MLLWLYADSVGCAWMQQYSHPTDVPCTWFIFVLVLASNSSCHSFHKIMLSFCHMFWFFISNGFDIQVRVYCLCCIGISAHHTFKPSKPLKNKGIAIDALYSSCVFVLALNHWHVQLNGEPYLHEQHAGSVPYPVSMKLNAFEIFEILCMWVKASDNACRVHCNS